MSFATDHVLRERAAQELREMQRRLETMEHDMEERSALWKRYDDALDALNTQEDSLAADELYYADKILAAVRRSMEADQRVVAAMLLPTAEGILFKQRAD